FLIANPGLVGFTPIFLLPLTLQRILVPHPYENPPGVPVFGWSHAIHNLPLVSHALFSTNGQVPYAALVNCIGLISIVALGIAVIRRKILVTAPFQRHFLVIVLAIILGSSIIYISYYFGDPIHPASARFFLTLVMALAISPVLLHLTWPHVLPA